MVGIRLSSVWEQNIDGLVANHHTDWFGLWFGDHQTSLVPVFCPSLATKRPSEVIRIDVSHFLLSAGERPQTMVRNSVNTFHWLLMLRKLLMEKK